MSDYPEMERSWEAEDPNNPALGYMSLDSLRRVAVYLKREGLKLRSDVEGFLRANEKVKEGMVQITPHSIAFRPEQR